MGEEGRGALVRGADRAGTTTTVGRHLMKIYVPSSQVSHKSTFSLQSSYRGWMIDTGCPSLSSLVDGHPSLCRGEVYDTSCPPPFLLECPDPTWVIADITSRALAPFLTIKSSAFPLIHDENGACSPLSLKKQGRRPLFLGR